MHVYFSVMACAVLLAWMVYRYDLYDKEPWYLLVFALALGYAAFWGLGYVEDATNKRLGFYASGNIAGQAAIAASHEEIAKLMCVALIALVFRRHFNDPMDGLIYGSFVALGMALEESIFYVRLSFAAPMGETTLELAGREAVRLVLHILLGGLSGFGVGLFVERPRRRYWLPILAGWLAVSMTIHFLWDWLCGIPAAKPTQPTATMQEEMFQRGVAVMLMLVAMAAFAYSVKFGSRLSRARFAPDSASENAAGSARPLSPEERGES